MFGMLDLKTQIKITQTSVECPVVGCSRTVARQRISLQREERFRCSEHGIYVSPTTFEYEREIDNLLWKTTTDLELLDAIRTVKRESRMARDNSEDALSWNVFRYLENTQQLEGLLSSMTLAKHQQVELIYWSYSQKANGTWPLLNATRKEFGEVPQRGSEPDLIAMSDSGLFFIEAKFTASNKTPGPSGNSKKYSTGGGEWWKQVFISDFETAAIDDKKYELCRLWLLGSWLAQEMGRDFYLINVVLAQREKDIETRFSRHIRETAHQQFKRFTWEGIADFVALTGLTTLEKRAFLAYFDNKTTGYDHRGTLQRAFSQVNNVPRNVE